MQCQSIAFHLNSPSVPSRRSRNFATCCLITDTACSLLPHVSIEVRARNNEYKGLDSPTWNPFLPAFSFVRGPTTTSSLAAISGRYGGRTSPSLLSPPLPYRKRLTWPSVVILSFGLNVDGWRAPRSIH